MMRDRSLAIWGDMGSGKTMIALARIHEALIDGTINNALVVCPASLITNWHLAIRKMSRFEGYTDIDADLVESCTTIVSYSKLWRTRFVPTSKGRRKDVILRDEVDHPWDMIILDESHALGNPTSNQTKACLLLARHSTYRYILTGTPDNGMYIKLFGQIQFLNPNQWRNVTEFKKRAVISYDRYFKPRIYDREYCESLKAQYGLSIRLKDCIDLPGMIETTMSCPVACKKAYEEIKDGHWERYGLNIRYSGSSIQKLLELTSGHLHTVDGIVRYPTSRLDVLEDILDGTEDKVVVFFRYVDSGNQIEEMLCKKKMSYYRYDGGHPDPTWKDYQEDDTKVFLVQYAKGCRGIDLYASHICVYYELTYSAEQLEQSRFRIHRIGQTQKCLYYYLCSDTKYETKIWQDVRDGVDISRKYLDQLADEQGMTKR